MKKIGIITAMKEEMQAIKEIMYCIEEKEVSSISVIEGIINKKECVLVESGVGKVNAAMITQILIENYQIEYIINVGSAAASNDEINLGDIVIGKYLVQHDFDITAFGHKKGYISNVGKNVSSSDYLIERIRDVINKINQNDYKVKIGTIASGDIFCTSIEMKNEIYENFNADAIEMEGAAIAQVCYLNKVDFIVIRSISDNPNGENAVTFREYLSMASNRCAKILEDFIK